MDFIFAKESPLFIRVFRIYVKWFFKWNFRNIWIHQAYSPSDSARTIYFLNHSSWWDGLIPFLLNEFRFHQQARAFMELEQMRTYRFFKWMGAFSIDPGNQIHTLHSMRYAVESMQRQHSSLFIYPQGEIEPVSQTIKFKSGIGWLCEQFEAVDVVPVGIHIQTVRYHRPELHIWIDDPLEIDVNLNGSQITDQCEQNMHEVLKQLIKTAGFDDEPYELFF